MRSSVIQYALVVSLNMLLVCVVGTGTANRTLDNADQLVWVCAYMRDMQLESIEVTRTDNGVMNGFVVSNPSKLACMRTANHHL